MGNDISYLQQCSNTGFMALCFNKSVKGLKENWIKGAD